MSLVLIVLTPFLGALLPGLMVRTGRQTCAVVTLGVTLTALVGLISQAPAVLGGETVIQQIPWMPELGLNLNLMLDGLGLFFAALILGIGVLIIIYGRYYLAREDNMGEFFAYLLLFQGAMVGIVLSDNILVLLVFWELTSLSSFLLIGYWKHLPDGRQGARMALTVTGMGGLAMIGGMLLLGRIVGSYDLSVILENREAIQDSPLYVPALVLILLGCFTKSAQFPFHFWLPHAMAAPTPVSAYLHSATMVKAGIFLLARTWPVLSGTEIYFYLVAGAGLLTMLVGAITALFKDDLKALLAFSTISHLGLIVFLLGTGTDFGALAAVFHILNHAAFKAALFMTAGIVDHEAHTRDIKRLGGLARLMPVTFAIASIAGLAMAGIPLFNGFLSKEMFLEEAAHTEFFGPGLLVPVLATVGALFSAAYSFRYIGHTFLGRVRDDYPAKPHDPGMGMWGPPAFLCVLVLGIGILPGLVEPLVFFVARAVMGTEGQIPEGYHLAIWHGVTPALWMSVVAVLGGLALVLIYRAAAWLWAALHVPRAKSIFDGIIAGAVAASRGVTNGLHDGAFSRYAGVFMAAVLALGVHAWVTGESVAPSRETLPMTAAAIAGWALLVAAALALAVFHRNRLFALILVGILGLMVSLGFVVFSAPDLAMTQILVEVVTIILLLLALNFLPNDTPKETGGLKRAKDIVLAAAGGLATGGLAWQMLRSDFVAPTISDYHLENSYYGGGGTNVVNVILVDFRGFDTFGEIIVLGIAALVIYALTEALLAGPVRAKLYNRRPDKNLAGDRHPLMMVVLTRVIMPLVLLVAIYIFLRGHNMPGGGFIAGLVAAIALVMQYLASGFYWAEARQRYPYHGIIGAGVLIAGLTGIGAWFTGYPFLTSSFTYIHIPPIEEFEVASAMAFDLGVFLTVVGAVMLSLESFARLARRADQRESEHPMDIDPSRVEDRA
ncbi:multisubunit potassium/proton antiporter, PhaA subunit (TC 2.A.63.1.1)/multisubunit potassium/proton antiporter, PhaB subunit (TC 2.A.63.1.1) [Palleronia marisminoris]|uniref:Na(+)/H(+) antiporter subunit A n=1 Tax=Palleronia marisminoris TaxID=315423 RepID=A0A1Y5SZ49_9RHOB|nr:monovalent cation/H+ antiporter subunit A [Palleronia marisminoris]SFH07886.1 multisubunit potassium/proton antiporter, PhaA subunit (TC 2.A.63.1.1)/multisubunit potassium/proton antiporter, PhaB subunit (TC 2.A.63.1.1) [Palleronia marisminoris]SLN51992.1 Na(+)/H(+) antiporter subunit A [Palleronia marisminoris]